MTLALFEHYNYIVYAALMMTGLYAVLARTNLVKKVIGLTLFQTAVFLFYISIGKIDGGTLPVFLVNSRCGPPRSVIGTSTAADTRSLRSSATRGLRLSPASSRRRSAWRPIGGGALTRSGRPPSRAA